MNPTFNPNTPRNLQTRWLRLVVTKTALTGGGITREAAIDMLRGNLRFGDNSTQVDDSKYLDMTLMELHEEFEKLAGK